MSDVQLRDGAAACDVGASAEQQAVLNRHKDRVLPFRDGAACDVGASAEQQAVLNRHKDRVLPLRDGAGGKDGLCWHQLTEIRE
jgi:hypothetical protein